MALIIRNRFLPLGRRYTAINLLGIIFVKTGANVTPVLINHERIHSAQMRELAGVFFYLIYLMEWIIRMIQFRADSYRAYRNISFEKEAYEHENDPAYLSTRRHWAQWIRQ